MPTACSPGHHPALPGDNWTATGQPGPLCPSLPRPGQWFGASPRGLGKGQQFPEVLLGPGGLPVVGHKEDVGSRGQEAGGRQREGQPVGRWGTGK